MDLRPWDYWMRDGTPYPGRRRLVATLESVLARNPNHPGANHLYIHAMEATKTPGEGGGGGGPPAHADARRRATWSTCRRTSTSAWAATRTRWRPTRRRRRRTRTTSRQCRAQGIYPMAYYPHNIHFLWFAATMEGRSADGHRGRPQGRGQGARTSSWTRSRCWRGFRVVPYYALTRFGKWDEMLAEPRSRRPPSVPEGGWHYARGLALLRKGQPRRGGEGAGRGARGSPPTRRSTTRCSRPTPRPPSSPSLPRCWRARSRRSASSTTSRSRTSSARCASRTASSTPSPRSGTTRRGRPWPRCCWRRDARAEAETVYWDDLRRNPDNGWSLFGLTQALRAQDKKAEADARPGPLRQGLGDGRT